MEPIEWRVSRAPVAYPDALSQMEARVEAIARGRARQQVWLLEHPPLYTKGSSAKPEDLLEPERFEVFDAGRGGEFTYHGPGQRVAYAMLDLKARGRDVRAFVRDLESWLIETLLRFDVRGEVREGRVGVWVDRGGGREDKIAAIGVRLRRWISFHGVSLNVDPDLSHFAGIVPCGIAEHGVTSLADLGKRTSMAEADAALRRAFEKVFACATIDPSEL